MLHRNKFFVLLTVFFIAFFFLCSQAKACGAFFPDSITDRPDVVMDEAPSGVFAVEVKKIKLPGKVQFKASNAYSKAKQTAYADVKDLRAALKIRENNHLVNQYSIMRNTIKEYSQELLSWKQWQLWHTEHSNNSESRPKPSFPEVTVPEGLPEEFALYTQAALYYHQNKPDEAIATWKALLHLPEKKRRYKSTWASFMIAKTILESDPAEALTWFVYTRKRAFEGCADSLGLASSSYGWEAKAEFRLKHYPRSIELYLAHYASGDDTALASLQWVARSLLNESPQTLAELAQNTMSRQLIMAYLVSFSPDRSQRWYGRIADTADYRKATGRWLQVVETAGLKSLHYANRLAWIAYKTGEYTTAAEWLDKSPENDAIANWIRAKLLLRTGAVDKAAELLATVVKAIPQNKDNYYYCPRDPNYYTRDMHPVRGELAVLQLTQRQYVEALDQLLRGEYWLDAAYVAEQVLTIQELITYVDRNWPTETAETKEATTGKKIRHLLARRLVRTNMLKKAAQYFPEKYKSIFKQYVEALGKSSSSNLSKIEKARYLWKAAQTTRHHGLEIMGTELEPDWFLYKGSFSKSPFAERRVKAFKGSKIIQASHNERNRQQKHKIKLQKRFHYRYIAAGMAWDAAHDMPDESPETATVLCTAGIWLKGKDPKAADRFYKALVRRCGTTELGKKADELRWFPAVGGSD